MFLETECTKLNLSSSLDRDRELLFKEERSIISMLFIKISTFVKYINIRGISSIYLYFITKIQYFQIGFLVFHQYL